MTVLIAAVATGMHVGAAMLVWRQLGVSVQAWAFISDAVLWIPLSAMAVLIALRGARQPGTTMVALSTALTSLNYALVSVEEAFGEFRPLLAAEIASALLAAAVYLRSSQLFPRPLTPADLELPSAPWQRWPRFRRALAAGLRLWAPWVIAFVWVVGTIVAPPTIVKASSLIVILIGAAYYYVRFRIGTNIDRSRVTWLLQMVLVFAVLYVVALSLRASLESAGAGENAGALVRIGYNVLAAIGGVGCLAMAVFSAGAFNPSLVVRSTVIYGAAFSLLLFALNVITSALVDAATDAFGLSDRFVAATLGAIAGLLLEPLAKGLRRLLTRTARA
jgi:hypothetical protein